MSHHVCSLISLLLLFTFTGPSGAGQPLPVSQAINELATDLYTQLRSSPENLFFSPYSLSAVLTMSYAGASGKTKEEMANVLHLLGVKESVIHEELSRLDRSLSSQSLAQFKIANALWVQKNKVLVPEFTELLQKTYRVGVNTADFKQATEEERLRINAWVANQTADKISELLKPGLLTAQTRLILINAMYFKGKWEAQFLPEKTHSLPFLKLDGKEIKVPTMHREGWLNYFENNEAQMIELNYQSSPTLSMVILLPKNQRGLSQIEEKLGSYLHQDLALPTGDISVYLPKFKVEATFELREILRKLGMIEAFEQGRADFSNMIETKTEEDKLWISNLIHRAVVEVNEEGTEAVAATGGLNPMYGVMEISREFRADHPFIFWIREKQSGVVLFLGRVMEPVKNNGWWPW